MPPQTFSLEELKLSDYKIIVMNTADFKASQGMNLGGWGTGSLTDITPIVQSIDWSYDINNPVETYTVKVAKTPNLYRLVQRGFRIFIHAWKPSDTGIDYGVLKTGIIWETQADTTQDGDVTIIAHDVMIYLSNNKSSHRMQQNEKASEFIKRILSLNGIPTDQIQDTQIQLGPFGGELFINRTLLDMCSTALQYTRDLAYKSRIEQQQVQYGALKFLIRSSTRNPGKVEVIQKKEPKWVWLFKSGAVGGNVIDASNKYTLEGYKNVIKVYNRASPDITQPDLGGIIDLTDPLIFASAPAENPPGSGQFVDSDGAIAKYGILSESIDFTGPGETGETQPDIFSQAQWQAQDYLRRFKREWQSGTISTFNVNTLRAGDPVWADIPQIGMTGKFYIQSGQHTVTASQSKMVLTVNFEDFLPFIYRSSVETQTGMMFQSFSTPVSGGTP